LQEDLGVGFTLRNKQRSWKAWTYTQVYINYINNNNNNNYINNNNNINYISNNNNYINNNNNNNNNYINNKKIY